MEKQIGKFTLYEKQPNDIKFGSLYTGVFNFKNHYFPIRTVRVYLPECYVPNHKYPYIVMYDGQNIVDKYTTAYGSWDLDERINELTQVGYEPVIIIGIDSAFEPMRSFDASFNSAVIDPMYSNYLNKPVGYNLLKPDLFDLYSGFKKNVMPEIKKCFSLTDDVNKIGVGGSSMGGAFAISAMAYFPEDFGFCLAFSPAYNIYLEPFRTKFLDDHPVPNNKKIYLYSGKGDDFERMFVEPCLFLHNYLKNKGFDDEHVTVSLDENGIHHETAWTKEFPKAIKFWNK